MDSPPRESDISKKKKKREDEDNSRSKSSLRRSFKWLLERGGKKKNLAQKRSSSEDDEDSREVPSSRQETPEDPERSGLDLFDQSSSNSDRLPGANDDNSSDYAVNLGARQSEDANDIEAKSTPGRKRLATRTLSLTSDSSDSEVEFNHLCGTSTKGKGRRSLEKRKGKRKKEEIQHEGRCPAAGGIRDEREGKGKGKDKGKRLVKKSSQPRRQEFDPPQDDEFDKVVVQFAKSPPAARLAATSGLHASTSRDITDDAEDDDGDNDADDDDDDDEDEVRMDEGGGGALVGDEDDATIMVLKRGKKSGGRTGSTWPRQSDAPTTSSQSASGTGVAATHPRGRGNRPGVPNAEVRNLIKSPSQKSGIGSSGGGSGSGGSIGSGGDVEVRVRTTARGTSVSVLLPSGNASGGSGNNNTGATVSGRSSSSRDVRTGGGTFLPPSQTTALQRRRRQSSSARRNSLPAATHHSIHSPPLPPSAGFSASAGYSAVTASSFPDMTEETPMRGVAAAPLSTAASLTSRRTSVIQIDDDDDGDDDGDEEEDDDREDDEPVVEYERISSNVANRSEERDFPDVIEEDDARMGAAGPSQSRSPDAVGVLNQIDDDARLARQLQEEFDREMASSLAREMERDARGRGTGSGNNVDGERMDESTSANGEEGEFVPGAPGPYYDLAATRRRLSRALATASSHVGAVSRAPPARRRAGGGGTGGGGALPLEFSLGFGFGSPLGGVVGGDITASDVEAILADEDDSTNESSNDSDVLYEESQRPTARGAFDIELGNARSARLATTRRAEGRTSSSRRGPQPSASIRRGVRASSTPSVQNEERNEDGIEEQNDVGQEEERRDIDDEGEGDDGQQSAPDLVSAPSVATPSAQAPRRSRRLQRGPSSGLLSSVGGSGTRAAAAATSRSGAAAVWSSLVASSPLSTSLNDVVGIPLQRVTSTTQLSSSSTSVDRGPPPPSGPRGLLRGRLARAAMTSSTPALNTLGLSVAPSAASRGPRPLSTSRSPTGRGPRPTPRGRTRPVSESLEAETNEDVSTSDAPTAAGESSASCAACEAIQSRIQTYLEEVRTLQDTPVEGYDANFERMRVTTQLMRQTNEAMREWRNHTSQAAHHSLEERSHRLNTMSAIYRQISEIIQGAVRGLSPGTPLSSTRSRSRASRSSRENANSTPSGNTSSSRTTRGQRYPGESSNAQFQFRRPRAPSSYPTPRLFVGQLPPGRLISLANGWPANLDYETLLRLGDIMGDVVPQGLSQTQINRLPTHIYNAEKQKATTASCASGGEREDHKQCHVCLTEYDEGEQLRILPCFHRFHSACIDEWIKTNPTCPLCRVRVEFDD